MTGNASGKPVLVSSTRKARASKFDPFPAERQHFLAAHAGVEAEPQVVPDCGIVDSGKLFGAIHAHLAAQGHQLQQGTIVDASIIAAPFATNNRERSREPEKHQTKKRNPRSSE